MAISVAVAVGDAGDRLIEALKPELAAIHVLPGTADGADMGPLVTREHLDRVLGYVDTGIQEGAALVVDGRKLAVPGHERGFFMGPVLFDRVTETMRIYREEIFGPVLVVLRVPDLDAALGLIERHEYGNGTAIFTRDGGAAREFTRRVAAGMVGVNVPIPVPMAFHSFGGWKRSLFGPLHMHGPDGVRFYTRLKTVTARWPEGSRGRRVHDADDEVAARSAAREEAHHAPEREEDDGREQEPGADAEAVERTARAAAHLLRHLAHHLAELTHRFDRLLLGAVLLVQRPEAHDREQERHRERERRELVLPEIRHRDRRRGEQHQEDSLAAAAADRRARQVAAQEIRERDLDVDETVRRNQAHEHRDDEEHAVGDRDVRADIPKIAFAYLLPSPVIAASFSFARSASLTGVRPVSRPSAVTTSTVMFAAGAIAPAND